MSFPHSYDTLLLPSIFELFLLGICISGDHSLAFMPTLKSKTGRIWLRAGTDNATHGCVALVSWAVVEMTSFSNVNTRIFMNCIICACLAVLVDLDHFLAAGSFRIQDAVSLSKRPPFHATTIIPVIFSTLLCTGYILQSKQIKILSFIYLTSWLSHHIRDATRRGLWLPPFGSTPAIPYWMYIFLILFLPLCVRTCLWYFAILEPDVQSNSNDSDSV